MDTNLIFFAGFLLLLAGILLRQARRLRRESGLPDGAIVYQDTGAETEVFEPLFSKELGLVGRPDYLLRLDDDVLVPVELKSGRAPRHPYAGHLMQLVAYCVLVEETTGRRPPFGILRYTDHGFEIPFSTELEEDLLGLLDDMRADFYDRHVPRNHQEPARCASCSMRAGCSLRLS